MRALLLGCLMVAATTLSAQEAPSGREALERFASGLDTLSARFEQVILGPEGTVESQGGGEVWLSRPGLFRWAYEGDFPELIVADGEKVWMHDIVMEQVTVKPQSVLAQDSPLAILTEFETLDAQFDVRELGEHDDMLLLELSSKTPESEFERVLLGMADDTLRLMVMEDAFGLRTELRFSEVVRNPQIAPDLFHFDLPPGTDVIGEADLSD